MGPQAFEQNVGGYFENGEADVEKSEADVILCIRHSKIGNQLDSLSPRSVQRRKNARPWELPLEVLQFRRWFDQ